MALKTVIENLAKARRNYEEQLAKLGKGAQKGIAEALAEVLPDGYAIQWTQYTPYFNDGEACTFGVNDPSLRKLSDDDSEDEDNDPDNDEGITFSSYGSEWNPVVEGVTKKCVRAVKDVWDGIPEDMLEQAFGDHVAVLIRKDGTFEVSEYSHD